LIDSNEIVLQASNLSKGYKTRNSEKTWQPFRYSTVRSLNGLSFSARKGETIGLVGANGAGKSTLLKILAGTTAPSSGRVLATVKPRLLTLRKVLIPRLSVLENVEISFRAIGFNASQARKESLKLIETAGLGDKTYLPFETLSTGQVARINFFLATIENPEILLLDELLSVTDKTFNHVVQDWLSRIFGGTTTTILASHSESVIRNNCARTIVLDRGNLVFDGETSEALDFYRKETTEVHPRGRRC